MTVNLNTEDGLPPVLGYAVMDSHGNPRAFAQFEGDALCDMAKIAKSPRTRDFGPFIVIPFYRWRAAEIDAALRARHHVSD